MHSLEKAGPCFIKFGQWAATRQDLFPQEFCVALSRLQNETEAHSLDYTLHLLRSTYAVPLEDVFESFEKSPIGSGCIAQVYKAKLKSQFFPSFAHLNCNNTKKKNLGTSMETKKAPLLRLRYFTQT